MSNWMTPSIVRLCRDIAAQNRWFIVESDMLDPAWIAELLATYVQPDVLTAHYAAGSLTLDEFECCVEIVLRGESVRDECASQVLAG